MSTATLATLAAGATVLVVGAPRGSRPPADPDRPRGRPAPRHPAQGRPRRGVGPARPRARSGSGDHDLVPGGPALPRLAAVLGGGALLVAVVMVGVGGAAALGGTVLGVRAVGVRRARAAHRAAVDRELPEVVDLFVVAASAGHPVVRCLEAVSDRAPPASRVVLGAARARLERGASLADALVPAGPELGTLGPVLVDALLAAHRTGAPLVPALARVADTARDRRRRAGEEAARRLPVTLLFPLVLCVLPAFGLLAVVPLLAGSIGSLDP